MLSLTKGKPIALITTKVAGVKPHYVFIKDGEDDEEKSDIDMAPDHKVKILTNFLKLDPKLSLKDMNIMTDAYSKGIFSLDGKLERKYDDAIAFVKKSLKCFLQYPKSESLFPVISPDEGNYRLLICGNTGSGKSWFCKEFIKHNRRKGQTILLFCPFEDDESFKGLKDIIYCDLDNLEDEIDREFTIEDIPKHSIVIFDDIDSSRDKKLVKRLESLRDKCLQIGRHKEYDISTISIIHNAMAGNATKVCLRESSAFVCFPAWNMRDTKALLKTYSGYTEKAINELLSQSSRWAYCCKRSPTYYITEHSVRLFTN